MPNTMTADQVAEHRARVMQDLGLTDADLELVTSRRRGQVTKIRERLVVGLRDTPTKDGGTMSWPCIAEAIGLARESHPSPYTIYYRMKPRV